MRLPEIKLEVTLHSLHTPDRKRREFGFLKKITHQSVKLKRMLAIHQVWIECGRESILSKERTVLLLFLFLSFLQRTRSLSDCELVTLSKSYLQLRI